MGKELFFHPQLHWNCVWHKLGGSLSYKQTPEFLYKKVGKGFVFSKLLKFSNLQGIKSIKILYVNVKFIEEYVKIIDPQFSKSGYLEHCPRNKIKLPAEERSEVVVAVKRGSGFPSSRWMRSKPAYTLCIFGDKLDLLQIFVKCFLFWMCQSWHIFPHDIEK